MKNIFVFLVAFCLTLMSCKDNSSQVNDTAYKYLEEEVPNFTMDVGDTIKYNMIVNMTSKSPDSHQYSINSSFSLIGQGDSLLKSIDFIYNTIDWTWIEDKDTIKLSTFSDADYKIPKIITQKSLNIPFESDLMNTSNWNEFYDNFRKDITSIKDLPLKDQNAFYQFYNTMLHSNWIRAKLRQIVGFGPKRYSYPKTSFEVGENWRSYLATDYEALTLHSVSNKCTLDSVLSDKLVVSITGELNGNPLLVNPECIRGNMVIDRGNGLVSYLSLNRVMRCEEIPSLNLKDYINTKKRKIVSDLVEFQEIKYERELYLELNLIK